MPSGPKRMNFHPWWRSVGNLSVTTAGGPATLRASARCCRSEAPVDLRDVQRAVTERDAVRRVEPARDRDDPIGFAVFVIVAERVDAACPIGADEDRPARALRQRPRVAEAFCEDGDLKPGWQLDLAQLDARRRAASLTEGDGRRSGRHHECSREDHGFPHIASCFQEHYTCGVAACDRSLSALICNLTITGLGAMVRVDPFNVARRGGGWIGLVRDAPER